MRDSGTVVTYRVVTTVPLYLCYRIVEVSGDNEPLMVSVSGDERTASAGPRGVKMIKKYFNPETKKLNTIMDYQHTEINSDQIIKKIDTLDIGKQTRKQQQ